MLRYHPQVCGFGVDVGVSSTLDALAVHTAHRIQLPTHPPIHDRGQVDLRLASRTAEMNA